MKRYTEMKPPEACLYSATPRGHLTMMGQAGALTEPIPNSEYTLLVSNGRQHVFVPLSGRDITPTQAMQLQQDIAKGERPDVLMFDAKEKAVASELFNDLCAVYNPSKKQLILTSRRATSGKGLN